MYLLLTGQIHPSETGIIENISGYIGISSADFYIKLRNMFIPETDSSYKILEIESLGYRRRSQKSIQTDGNEVHPDKVSHLGEDFKKVADEKFKKVNEAYERIKNERNMP